jgi:hypothetical protein
LVLRKSKKGMEQIFAKFEEGRGAVNADLLIGIFNQIGAPAPERETLEKFIESVYAEREEAERFLAGKPDSYTFKIGDAVRRHGIIEFHTSFQSDYEPVTHQLKANTCWETFINSVEKYPNNNLYGNHTEPGKYTFKTYAEVFEDVKKIGSGFLEIGVKPKQFVGVMLDTSYEWGACELAFWSQVITKNIL